MKTFISKDELDRTVQYFLYQHRGEINAVDRWALVEQVFGERPSRQNDGNTQDRQIRDSVERLRNAGNLICNLGDGSGYFIANTADEYQRFRQIYGAHAFPIMATIRRMDQAAGEKFPNPLQPSLL